MAGFDPPPHLACPLPAGIARRSPLHTLHARSGWSGGGPALQELGHLSYDSRGWLEADVLQKTNQVKPPESESVFVGHHQVLQSFEGDL